MSKDTLIQKPCVYGACQYTLGAQQEIAGVPGAKPPCENCFFRVVESPLTTEPEKWTHRSPDFRGVGEVGVDDADE